jgi:autotransporter-associated beta strand protein
MSPLYAAQDTWLGTTDGNWATTTNWSVVPVDGDSLLFTGIAPNLTTNDNLSSLTTISGITFDATAGAYTLNGATATLGLSGGISDLSTAADAINLNLALGGTESISVTQSAGLLTIGGTISGSGFGITKTGVGTLTLTGADTYTGPTTVSAGILKLDFNAAGAATTILNPSSGLVLGGVAHLPSMARPPDRHRRLLVSRSMRAAPSYP